MFNDTPSYYLIYSRTEDGSTYTNHRAAVLDGNMIIVTHTPATLAESIIIGKYLAFISSKNRAASSNS